MIDGSQSLAAGAELGGRYRIIELVGRGGMSEVYLAHDTTLDQRVALKLLPREHGDEQLLESLHNEVRQARQVSHPNVCRVFDVFDTRTHRAVSMEYVDGQSLELLLRQTGRLSHDSALTLGRQLCAGLAAAHDAGVIHRDLKPSNVLIDRDGRARITDFGLAATRDDAANGQAMGTTTYMAPEQFTTGATDERSDIYSLGLVLYRIFTGRDAIEPGHAIARAAGLDPKITPSSPSTHVPRLDPAVERTILRCLEHDPARRPPSARAVDVGLPGSSALAAARDAGELLDPSLLAMVESAGALPRPVAVAAAVVACAGMLLAIHWAPRTQLVSMTPPAKPAAYLAERSRELALDLVGVRIAGGRYGFDHDRAPNTDPIAFRFRTPDAAEAPGRLTDGDSIRERSLIDSRRTLRPVPAAGLTLTLDSSGRLRAFGAAPRAVSESSITGPRSWARWFAAAGLTLDSFVPTAVGGERPAGDALAWRKIAPDARDGRRFVEAVSLDGRPIWFRVSGSPDAPATAASPRASPSNALRWSWLVVVILGAVALAWRNLRLGAGDRRGALRVAAAMLVLTTAGWFADDLLGFPRIDELRVGLASAIYFAVTAWLFYLALEPTVRRIWPEITVSWIRILDGRARDPLVGRDVLIGALLGVSLVLTDRMFQLLVPWVGGVAPRPEHFGFVDSQLQVVTGFRYAVGEAFWMLRQAIWGGLGTVLLMLLLRLVLRWRWVAVAGLVVAGALAAVPAGAPLFPTVLLTLFQMVLLAAVLLRAGFLAVVTGLFVFNVLSTYPVTLDVTAWYGELGAVGAAIVVAVIAWGAVASQLGPRGTTPA